MEMAQTMDGTERVEIQLPLEPESAQRARSAMDPPVVVIPGGVNSRDGRTDPATHSPFPLE